MSRARDMANIVSNGQQATAWCYFDGTLTGTNPPIDGFNVESVTRNGPGDYIINFSEPMDNDNWSISATFEGQGASIVTGELRIPNGSIRSTTQAQIFCAHDNNAIIDATDCNTGNVVIFGGKD